MRTKKYIHSTCTLVFCVVQIWESDIPGVPVSEGDRLKRKCICASGPEGFYPHDRQKILTNKIQKLHQPKFVTSQRQFSRKFIWDRKYFGPRKNCDNYHLKPVTTWDCYTTLFQKKTASECSKNEFYLIVFLNRKFIYI